MPILIILTNNCLIGIQMSKMCCFSEFSEITDFGKFRVSGESRDFGESGILANLIMYGEFVDCVYSGILVNCVILVNLGILVSP